MKIEELKEEVDILEVVEFLGGRQIYSGAVWSSWAKTVCPFCDDTNGSASLNREKQAFNCHQCGVAGDIVNLAKEELGTTDTKAACRWLEDTFL